MMKWFGVMAMLLLAACGVTDKAEKAKSHTPEFDLPIPDYTKMALQEQMRRFGFALGAKVYIRIIKDEHVLELWMLKADGKYHLYQKFPICVYSGDLGPKTRQGDKQSPEGFYDVTKSQMKPDSRFHLAFNLGFPNAYDRAHGYTGNYLMVHGNCVSVGCYAMGDSQIEVIYAIVSAAQQRGQYAVPVASFPFRMTQENLLAHQDSQWFSFWTQLKPAWDYFELRKVPPKISVENGQYVVSNAVGVESNDAFTPKNQQNAPAAAPVHLLLAETPKPEGAAPQPEAKLPDVSKPVIPRSGRGPIATPVSVSREELAQPETLKLLSKP